jgi:hypothetical protein
MTKELNRKALYDLVWSQPMSTIAKDYGLSDRGMAKLCDRNSIPVPPRGYWAKKAAGQKVHKAPLIVLEEAEPDTAILLREAKPIMASTGATPDKKEEPALPPSIQEAIARESLPENQIKAPATLHNPHPIVSRWIKDEERDAEMNKRFGGISFRSPVTSLERRRRRIISTLFKELEERGFKIIEEGGNYYHKDHWITYERDKVSFNINERIKQYRRELTTEEKEERNRYHPSSQKWTRVQEPTGTLEITLSPGGNSYSKIKIQEEDSKPFEDTLNEVVVKVIEAMWSEKSERLKKEERDRQCREEEHARYLLREAAENEQQRKINLEKKAFSWKRAQAIREYITAVEAARDQGRLQVDEGEFSGWRTWAMAHADDIDFIANGNPLIKLSEDPEDIDDCDDNENTSNRASGSSRHWFPGQKWYHK